MDRPDKTTRAWRWCVDCLFFVFVTSQHGIPFLFCVVSLQYISLVHHLLHKSGLVKQWNSKGKSHVVFLQDTNALVVNSILPTLGVSAKNGFAMNSICIPRIPGEAAGAITRLEYVQQLIVSCHELARLLC
jgi:hypothetical protein